VTDELLDAVTLQFLQDELQRFDQVRGQTANAKHFITLRDDKPLKQRNELLRVGRIEPSRTPHSAPLVLVLVRKKTGGMRICVDNSQLNAHSIPDA